MEPILCPLCNTTMCVVQIRPVFRSEALTPPSYGCPKCGTTAVCDKKGQLTYYDPMGKVLYASHDR